ncbi:hypothetical protein [Pseudomonas putida]|uniref:hypothetical protein n=1 Tax=Pseudomonas putida TaxID=303 RepID=UPI00235BB755|nr:hypothetical protein [Pseudomonas putida]GLO47116.1 hypothetical protein PPUN109347_36790 [Pseudomonas putida]HDS0979130.1 hypothetical protein [Pseudomonas putida]
MPEFKILIEVIGDRLNVRHTIEKRDTEELSKFQALGLLYHMIDSVTQLDAGLEHSAVVVAREIFSREGWEAEVIELLLAAQNWEDRMIAAWNAVDEDARKAALSLDYQSFQNYWPSLDFCQPGWGVAVNSSSVSAARRESQKATGTTLH